MKLSCEIIKRYQIIWYDTLQINVGKDLTDFVSQKYQSSGRTM